ncbi:Glycosyltransferase involved in cell wall bisynthesis [Pseudobutyrivibrio sp. 49]|uniref:glycosyltransferase family 2 protein n=1 Tax=Pseudobutyrivibrio sp. 49 TaxID=1855344 RepID=UPI0008906282|nr:glycosyltransferase family 2 protein [Pseudobutyrivibrio sp. 49]SDI02988.1 Glycosyltransferase involved in cell wall bisynthesis [Pseudobutyrivibrio sp. 49]
MIKFTYNQDMNKTITTIIPFYNCGAGLCQMLDSILAGTVTPDEILLIDDGSTDNSPAIAMDYASKHPFIKYIHQDHAGVSTARNLGAKYATSHWISFLDADDYLEKNYYECMISGLTDKNIAGCVCGYFTEVDGLTTSYTGSYPKAIDSSTLLKAMFSDDNVRGFLFTRLFRAELIKDIYFNTAISMCEDLLFQTTLFSKNPDLKFTYINLPLYHYVQSSTSATNNINLFKGTVFKYKPAFDEIRNLISEDFVEDSYNSILEYSMYRLLKEYKNGNKEVLPQIRGVQTELKNVHPSHSSKRRLAYIIAPIMYSHLSPS